MSAPILLQKLEKRLDKANGNMEGNLDMSSSRITNLTIPSSSENLNYVVSKQSVDDYLASIII